MAACSLLTAEQREQLLSNGTVTAISGDHDPFPVVVLFTPDANATWMLSELDPDDPDMAFGLCDLGHGTPELGYVQLSELELFRGPLGLPIERDLSFVADRSLGFYTSQARTLGTVIL